MWTDAEGPGVRFGLDVSAVINGRQLIARYQPIVRLADASVLGYECYCRLDPVHGAVPTTTLFRAAGALGLTVALDRHCRERALAGLRDLPPDQLAFLNLSSVALSDESFDVTEMIESVSRAGLRPEQIVIEVTGQERPLAPRFVVELNAC